MSPISPGFRGRRVDVNPARVPPGHHVVRDFPVLSAGPTPHTPLDEWSLLISAAVLRPGDQLELRGPIGGYVLWRTTDGGPLLLVAGGPGFVPLMAMLRHRAAQSCAVDTRLLLSTRSIGGSC